jgi:head-tail adaptor
MTIDAGKLRHRVQVQEQQETRDPITGAVNITWVNLGSPRWAAIEPLSARELIQSAAVQSAVTARITMRADAPVKPSARILNIARGIVYNIHGVLADKESGLEYVTMPVSTGINDGQ